MLRIDPGGSNKYSIKVTRWDNFQGNHIVTFERLSTRVDNSIPHAYGINALGSPELSPKSASVGVSLGGNILVPPMSHYIPVRKGSTLHHWYSFVTSEAIPRSPGENTVPRCHRASIPHAYGINSYIPCNMLRGFISSRVRDQRF